MDEPMMTEAQRDELKALCQKADVPDKSANSHKKVRSTLLMI